MSRRSFSNVASNTPLLHANLRKRVRYADNFPVISFELVSSDHPSTFTVRNTTLLRETCTAIDENQRSYTVTGCMTVFKVLERTMIEASTHGFKPKSFYELIHEWSNCSKGLQEMNKLIMSDNLSAAQQICRIFSDLEATPLLERCAAAFSWKMFSEGSTKISSKLSLLVPCQKLHFEEIVHHLCLQEETPGSYRIDYDAVYRTMAKACVAEHLNQLPDIAEVVMKYITFDGKKVHARKMWMKEFLPLPFIRRQIAHQSFLRPFLDCAGDYLKIPRYQSFHQFCQFTSRVEMEDQLRRCEKEYLFERVTAQLFRGEIGRATSELLGRLISEVQVEEVVGRQLEEAYGPTVCRMIIVGMQSFRACEWMYRAPCVWNDFDWLCWIGEIRHDDMRGETYGLSLLKCRSLVEATTAKYGICIDHTQFSTEMCARAVLSPTAGLTISKIISDVFAFNRTLFKNNPYVTCFGTLYKFPQDDQWVICKLPRRALWFPDEA